MRCDRESEGESARPLATRRIGVELRRRRTLEIRRHVRQVRVVSSERSTGRIREPQVNHHDVLVRVARQLVVRVPVVVRTVESFRRGLVARVLVRVRDTHELRLAVHRCVHEHGRFRQIELATLDQVRPDVVDPLQRNEAEHRLVSGVLGDSWVGELGDRLSDRVDLRFRLRAEAGSRGLCVEHRRDGDNGAGEPGQAPETTSRHVECYTGARRKWRPRRGLAAAYRNACDPPPTTSIPPAIWPTSALATRVNVLRSIISTVPGSEPMPSTEMNAYRSSPEMATPCTTLRCVGTRASSLPDAMSMMETDFPRLFVPTSSLPSRVTARL